MKLGYLAVEERQGSKIALTGNKSPRQQLLEKCCRKHADKFYVDTKDGKTKHIGYIVAGGWYRIYEVHDWQGKE